MAGTTPNLGLYLPGGGSTGVWTPNEVADIDTINDNFVDIDTWAGGINSFKTAQEGRNQQFYGLAAAIGSVTGAKEGDTYQESDGNKILWKRMGGVWVTNEGMGYLIRPTSVVGGTVQPNGGVDFNNGATAVSVNNVFTPRFRNYLLQTDMIFNTDAGAVLRLRAGGADAAGGSDYVFGIAMSASAGTSGQEGAGSSWPFANSVQQFKAHRIELYGPNIAKRTSAFWHEQATPGGGGYSRSVIGSGFHTLLNAYDGFTLSTSTGNFGSGHVRIYGLT